MAVLAAAAGALLLAAACADGGGGADADPLLVLAASDLQSAIPELTARFEALQDRRVDVVLGATGRLTTQIEQGAPADVFLAANASFVDRLEARGLILPGTRRVYALGALALVSAPGAAPPRSLADLGDPDYTTIAIANPEHAPYGAAARAALQSAGVWDAVRPRLVIGETVAQTLQIVRTGNADAALVARGLVTGLAGVEYQPVDASLHPPIRQTGAVLRGSTRAAAATSFLEFVVGTEGRAILLRHGFAAPDTAR